MNTMLAQPVWATVGARVEECIGTRGATVVGATVVTSVATRVDVAVAALVDTPARLPSLPGMCFVMASPV